MAARVDYRLGSNAYDQDFDFVESYVSWYNGSASLDEKKSVQAGYISFLYKYKDKLGKYIDSLDADKLMRTGSYLYSNKMDTVKEVADKLARERLDKYKKDIFTLVDEIIGKIEKKFSIKKVQRAFLMISNGFCLFTKVDRHPEYYTGERNQDFIRFGSNYCYLTNDTGLFGFNTWLYSALNEVNLVGVPSNSYTSYDFKGGCPTTFIVHDYFHGARLDPDSMVYGATTERTKPRFRLAASIYKQIHLDPEATLLQKELLICVLWVFLHELPSRMDAVFTDKYSSEIPDGVDLIDEFERFRDLAISQELVDMYYQHFNQKSKTMEEVDKELGYSGAGGSRNWWKYLSFYFREYCLKYYDTSIPDESVPQILYS